MSNFSSAGDGPPASRTRPFHYAAPDGAQIRGDELPGAPPSYLFLHGLGSVRQGVKSDSLLAHAARHGRAFLRIDMRGHGESSGRIGSIPVTDLIADAKCLMQQLGRCVLVGSSLGGIVAAYAAAAAPNHVVALCLVAPALELLGSIERHLDRDGCMQTSNGVRFSVPAEVIADAKTLDERRLPGRLTVPTLIVHGTADAVIPHGASERFFAAIPHARKDLWIVPGGDHRLAEQAAALWQRLDRFVDGIAQ